MIGSPWKRSKRDRDIIALTGAHPAAGVPETGILPIRKVINDRLPKPELPDHKETE